MVLGTIMINCGHVLGTFKCNQLEPLSRSHASNTFYKTLSAFSLISPTRAIREWACVTLFWYDRPTRNLEHRKGRELCLATYWAQTLDHMDRFMIVVSGLARNVRFGPVDNYDKLWACTWNVQV